MLSLVLIFCPVFIFFPHLTTIQKMLLMEKYVYLSAAEEKPDQFVCVHAVPTKTNKIN
jgi:hypothetical protein